MNVGAAGPNVNQTQERTSFLAPPDPKFSASGSVDQASRKARAEDYNPLYSQAPNFGPRNSGKGELLNESG